MMTRRNLLGLTCAVICVAYQAAPQANAGLLDNYNASVLVQTTATDADALLLGQIYGFQPKQTLNYLSTGDSTSWSGSLSGTYAGTALSLSYSGDLSNYPAGAITWASTGNYGADAWSGTGSATITDLTATTFQVTLAYAMTAGGNSASIDYVIPGTVGADGSIMYGSPGNDDAGTGTLTVNGVPFLNLVEWSYIYPKKGKPIRDDIKILGRWFSFSSHEDDPLGGRSGGLIGTISTVPEPDTGMLAGLALLSAAAFSASRKLGFGRQRAG
jgi:hypothetical protein